MQIILLHGNSRSKHYFDQLETRLRSAPTRASDVFLDLPGFGENKKVESISKLRINWSSSPSSPQRFPADPVVFMGTRSEVFSLLPGLAKISRGCTNCFAEHSAWRRSGRHRRQSLPAST